MTATVAELISVTKAYEGPGTIEALANVNVRIRTAEFVAIVGPSGAGKSTLLNILGLLDRPTSGSQLFRGVDLDGVDDRTRTAIRATDIGFVFQAFNLLPNRTSAENVALGSVYDRHASRTDRHELVADALTRVGMEHRANHTPAQLSAGEQQRVGIARAILKRPHLLLCDEPTGSLDPGTAASIMDLLASLNDHGLTIVVVTHDEAVTERATTRIDIVDGSIGGHRETGRQAQGARNE